MINLPRHARLGWIALAAIVGLLSSAEGAAAGTMGGGRDHGDGCCVARPMDDCGCCSPAPSRAGPGAADAVPEAHRAQPGSAALRHTTSPCECRADDPAAPASKNEPPSSERRQGSDRTLACEVRHLDDEQPSPFAARRLSPGSSPPRTPLYLRTLRLLI